MCEEINIFGVNRDPRRIGDHVGQVGQVGKIKLVRINEYMPLCVGLHSLKF